MGTLSTLKAAVYFNLPIVNDTLAWSLAFERDSHDPYVAKHRGKKPIYRRGLQAGNGRRLRRFAPDTRRSRRPSLNNFDSIRRTASRAQNTYTASTKLRWTPIEHFSATLAGDYYYKDDTDGSQLQLATPAYTQGYVSGLNGLAGSGLHPQSAAWFCPGAAQMGFRLQHAAQAVGLKDWGTSFTARL
jgi:hypothetical protein